jgi:hypothetical protein
MEEEMADCRSNTNDFNNHSPKSISPLLEVFGTNEMVKTFFDPISLI